MGFLDQFQTVPGQQPDASMFNFAPQQQGPANSPTGLLEDQPRVNLPLQSQPLATQTPPDMGPMQTQGPQIAPRKTFAQRLSDAMASDSYDQFAAGLKTLGGDHDAGDELRKQQEAQYQKRIRSQAQNDQEAEAQAAAAAMAGGGWDQKKFNEVWASRSSRAPDLTHLQAYDKLYADETGMTKDDVPYSRKQGSNEVQYGQPAPMTPEQVAKYENDQRRLEETEWYKRAMIEARNRQLGISQQNADTNSRLGGGRLDVARGNQGIARDRLAFDKGKYQDPSTMDNDTLDATIAALRGGGTQ